MRLTFPLFLLLSAAVMTWANSPEQARDNLARDFFECAAYYTVTSEAPDLSDSAKQTLSTLGGEALGSSMKLSDQTAVLEGFSSAMRAVRREMGRDWSNRGIIDAKYESACRDLLKDSEAKVQYWLEEE